MENDGAGIVEWFALVWNVLIRFQGSDVSAAAPIAPSVNDFDAGAEFRVFSRGRREMTAGRSIINNPTRA